MKLMGLWIGLTLALVYCATIGVYLCLVTDWNHEVQKVIYRLEAEREADKKMRGEAAQH
jgi:MATE family multidrug resistance protein